MIGRPIRNPKEKTMLFAALAPILAIAAPVGASEFQSTAMLDVIVAQFTGKAVKLAACTAPQLEWRNAAKDAVVVRCMEPGWRIFVPVNAAPQPKAAPAVTVAAPIAVKPAPAARAEPVIRRGDAVTVEAGAAGFSIAREGVAMSDAPAGGRLTVKVDEKKPPIQAVAVEPGRAKLPGWGD
jgi:flagella basal body P-ring formation protein FlgA